MGTIHIAYALNDNYAEMTCVSMCSVLENRKNAEIVFHLFAEDISRENTEKLNNLCIEQEKSSVIFHDISIDGELFVTTKYDGYGSPNLTKETYVRVLMPDLLPELERLLYLDCDTIVVGDLAQLWETDLEGEFVGMVPDYSLGEKEKKKQILGLERSSIYFNGGVILMDISKLREYKLSRIATENVKILYDTVTSAGMEWFADQEVLNYVLQNRIKKLPMRYNSYFWISLPCDERIDECIKALLNPIIVHFIATPKPTELGNASVLLPDWERYYKYKAMSPYAAEGDEEKIALYKAREAKTLDALKPCDFHSVRWYCTFFAKQIFELSLLRYKTDGNGKGITIWGLNAGTWILTVFLAAHGVEVKRIVDGLEGNQGIEVFDYSVESPEVLRGSSSGTYVMLDMRNYDIAQQVMEQLQIWGYSKGDFYYVYAPLWEGTD